MTFVIGNIRVKSFTVMWLRLLWLWDLQNFIIVQTHVQVFKVYMYMYVLIGKSERNYMLKTEVCLHGVNLTTLTLDGMLIMIVARAC